MQSGCIFGDDLALIAEFSIPDKATAIRKIELNNNTHQLYFEIKKPYPDISVLDSYEQDMVSSNWTRCEPKSISWKTFEDRANKPYLRVHQANRYWIDAKGQKLLNIGALYYSENLEAKTPDNDVQRVTVWVQKVSNIFDEIKRLGLKCSTNPSSTKHS